MKDTRHGRGHMVWFHLHEIQAQVKLTCGDRVRLGNTDFQERAWGNFLEEWTETLLSWVVYTHKNSSSWNKIWSLYLMQIIPHSKGRKGKEGNKKSPRAISDLYAEWILTLPSSDVSQQSSVRTKVGNFKQLPQIPEGGPRVGMPLPATSWDLDL